MIQQLNQLFLVCFLCCSAVFALELKNLCEERVYLNNALINAFYQLKLDKDLEPISNYVNDDGFDGKIVEEILNQLYSNRLNLTEIVQKFHSLNPKTLRPFIRNIRSPRNRLRAHERTLTTPEPATTTVIGDASVEDLRPSAITTLQTAEEYMEKMDKLQQPINKLRRNLKLLELNQIGEEWVAKEDLKLELDSINQDLNDTQTSVFQNQILDAFYDRPIAMLDGLTVERNQSIYLDDTAVGTLHFSLYIPFYDQNRTLDENCYNISSLPLFYRVQTLNSSFSDLSNAQFLEEIQKLSL